MQVDLTRIKAERARRRLYHFVQEFWSEIIPEDPVWNWHIEFLCDQIQQEFYRVMQFPGKNRQPKLHDTIINIPPGTSKSTIVTVMAPAWAWTNDPTLRILTASYSGDLATDHAVKSRDIIQSAKYKLFFPEVEIRSDQNNKTNYKNTALGERYATSVGGTVTGFHAHIILCLPYYQTINTDKGEIPIGEIVENKIECLVLSYNEITGEAEYKPILKYEKNPFRRLVRVTTASGKTLDCTEDHLVFTHNRGYVEAINLCENDEIEINY